MDLASFKVLEHKLPERIGLSLAEIVLRRNRDLVKGEDYIRTGRWIKYSEAGLSRLMSGAGLASVELPPEPESKEVDAEVTRCNFPNKHLIEVNEVNGQPRRLVRIKPEWLPMYRVKMKIRIITNGHPVATTRRPKERFGY